MMEFFEFVHSDYGMLVVEEIYQEFDDVPLLFSLFSETGVKFIATALSPQAYLLARFFESTKIDLFAKKIDINTAFHRGGDTCWVIKLRENGTTNECKKYNIDGIPAKYFPLTGANLIGYENRYFNEKIEVFRQEAVDKQYDSFSFRLLTGSLSVPDLCKACGFFNNTYKKLSDRSRRAVSAKTKLLPMEYSNDLQVLPQAGSVVLQFVALHNDNILESTEYENILLRLVDILDFQDPTLDAFSGLEYSLIDDVKKFSSLVARIGCNSELTAATSSGKAYHRLYKPSDMRNKTNSLKIDKRSKISTSFRDGRFYAGNLNTKHFNFVESGTSKVYSGKFAQGFTGISLNLEDMTVYEVEFEDEAILDPVIKDKIVTTNYRVISVKRKAPITLEELT